MPTTPANAKEPQDHKLSAQDELEAKLAEDELLADLPELKAPGKLRVRQRNKIMKIALALDKLDLEEGEELGSDDDRLPDMLDAIAEIDEFAETIATDPAAYVEWAEGQSYEAFTALLDRYASAVGE